MNDVAVSCILTICQYSVRSDHWIEFQIIKLNGIEILFPYFQRIISENLETNNIFTINGFANEFEHIQIKKIMQYLDVYNIIMIYFNTRKPDTIEYEPMNVNIKSNLINICLHFASTNFSAGKGNLICIRQYVNVNYFHEHRI